MNKITLCVVVVGLMLLPRPEKPIDVDRLAEAIRRAEGNANYGVLFGVIKSEPGHARYLCREIIRVRLEMWDGKGDFISYLQKSYCPIGASNDNGTNKFWIKNVKYFYNQ